jgi:hypothetical protein
MGGWVPERMTPAAPQGGMRGYAAAAVLPQGSSGSLRSAAATHDQGPGCGLLRGPSPIRARPTQARHGRVVQRDPSRGHPWPGVGSPASQQAVCGSASAGLGVGVDIAAHAAYRRPHPLIQELRDGG